MGAPGFDDAPLVTTIKTAKAKRVTLIYPYYENPRFLCYQVERWLALPADLRQHLSAIIVDDGSPIDPATLFLQTRHPPFPLRLFRIGVDRRWNWLAARNIGAHHAPEGWCLMTDMDHVAPEETLAALVYGEHAPGIIYRLSRREHDGKEIHPHPNSFFITRAMFWKSGGYDEALSGYYGTDGDMRRRLAATAPIRTLSEHLERHEYQGDSSTTTYKRKEPIDAAKKKIIATRGRGWRPRVLSFPYAEVAL